MDRPRGEECDGAVRRVARDPRAPHARLTQALARFERACGAIGRAAVKLAEEVDACIEFELTRRRVGFYKDMPSEQSIEQPTDMHPATTPNLPHSEIR